MAPEDFAINLLEVCEDAELWRIADAFPKLIGIVVHTYGQVDVIYTDNKLMREEDEHEFPGSIGRLAWSRCAQNIEITAAKVNAGFQVAGWANEAEKTTGCLGLRIRRQQNSVDSRTHSCETDQRIQGGDDLSCQGTLRLICYR